MVGDVKENLLVKYGILPDKAVAVAHHPGHY